MIRKAIIAALFCCACKDSTIAVGTIRGTYALRTVDGVSLPFTLSTVNGTVTAIAADSISLLEGNVFHETGARDVTTNGITTRTPTSNYGSYSLLSTSITLHSDIDAINRTGTIDGDTMTILDSNHVLILKRLR